MTTTLSPVPILAFRDNNGNPLANGQLFTYQAGTQTPAPTYTDSTGAFPNPNPVIMNARGECQVWIPPNTAYKYLLQDSFGNPIWSVDQIVNSQLLTLFGGVDTGSANAYVLNFAANFTTYSDGTIVYWIPANANTGPSTININGLGVIALVNQDGSALRAGQITPNLVASLLIKGGQALLLNNSVASSVLAVAGSTVAPSIAFLGDPSTGLYFPGAGQIGMTLAGGSNGVGVFSSGIAAFAITGMTATVNFNAQYYTNGLMVILRLPQVSGTSNSIVFSATSTTRAIWPPVNTIQWFSMPAMEDNTGGIYSQVGNVQTTGIIPTSALFTFCKGGNPSGWTNTGTKGIGDGSLSTSGLVVAYMLI